MRVKVSGSYVHGVSKIVRVILAPSGVHTFCTARNHESYTALVKDASSGNDPIHKFWSTGRK